MNRKNFPLFLMLGAGVVICIITFIKKYTMLEKLVSLFVVLIIFYVLGCILVWTVDYFEKQNEEKLKEEEEVIEEELETQEDAEQDVKQEDEE